ncbi:(Fe-S)-binding protein [Methylophaga sp.]|uniref:(Fe-S)-binding protein n=1 Tax=Methylophaga sp. TaxID=2024840 RepID=UPI002718B3D6|nr:(Fe-S)-binding protein [Methylophaga sp.]MDO8828093.1 (Fe-S)-binding protein [Methylophaga sp.]
MSDSMFDFIMDDNADLSYQSSGPHVPDVMDCMRCGLCLRQCPTYILTQDEQEGPRQRIRTLNTLVIENKVVAPQALEHLQNCIQCRACEAICPSQMDYSLLFDQAQQQLSANKILSFKAKTGLWLIQHKAVFNVFLPLIKLYVNSGLQKLSRNIGIIKKLGFERVEQLATVKPVLKPIKSKYPVSESRGTVALFAGCISDRFDRTTLEAAITVLNAIGFSVIVPEQQTCCGAMHWHNGQHATAKAMMTKNVNQFAQSTVTAIVYCASGCGSQLTDYQILLEGQDDVTEFHQKLTEISDFVLQNWPASLTLHTTNKHVLVHEPCSHRNVLKNQAAVYQLLAKIPSITINTLADNHLCCGAGGSYMLTHPDSADALRTMKWRHIAHAQGDYVATTNIGCALHLMAAKSNASMVQIIHPITLIANQL